MTTVIVHHQVADYDVWKPIFDEHGAARATHGCESVAIYRSATDPNAITVETTFPTLEQAQAFASDPSLKEAMGRGGVQGPPDIHFLETVETSVGAGA